MCLNVRGVKVRTPASAFPCLLPARMAPPSVGAARLPPAGADPGALLEGADLDELRVNSKRIKKWCVSNYKKWAICLRKNE